MTVMTEAMKKAGVFIPLNKRVWIYLKDHPIKSIKDISLALKCEESKVRRALADLESRNMVYHTKEVSIHRKDMRGRKSINLYRSIGDEYKLLPVRKIEKPIAPKPIQVEVKPKKFTIDDLSVVEAKQLYEQLKEIFG